MSNRILLVITVILTIVLIVVSSKLDTTFFNTKAVPNINVKDTLTDKIEKMNLEEYIIGVVAAEMPASFSMEALKAQAVASRTYAVYKMQNSKNDFDVVTDVSNQSYITIEEMQKKWQEEFTKYYTKIKDAVSKTKGEIMTYNDEVIESYYFAMSNGYTEDVELVFNEEKDYLKSVESSYDNETLKNFSVDTEFNKNDFCQKININCNNIVINDIERSNTHRVNYITINNKKIKGTEFRKLLNLRSTDFEITIKDNIVDINTKGYGHGVGMSQYGANGLANSGKNYQEILDYYYKNIKISSI